MASGSPAPTWWTSHRRVCSAGGRIFSFTWINSMATITARGVTAGTTIPAAGATQETASAQQEDHGLARFFYAAAVALLFSAVQGVVQRLPGISDWLQDADY